jgi:hypothetical protein
MGENTDNDCVIYEKIGGLFSFVGKFIFYFCLAYFCFLCLIVAIAGIIHSEFIIGHPIAYLILVLSFMGSAWWLTVVCVKPFPPKSAPQPIVVQAGSPYRGSDEILQLSEPLRRRIYRKFYLFVEKIDIF